MPVFAYRALTGGGRARGGVIGAESARAAWQELRARGVYPTDLREQAAGAGWAGRRLGAEELAAATRQLATLVGAGVPVAEALAAVAEQSEHPALVRGLTVAEARRGRSPGGPPPPPGAPARTPRSSARRSRDRSC